MSNYKDLIVWQRAIDLSAALHEIARGLPRRAGVPGLRAQLLRAAGSIHANLAEGSDASNADFARFVTISIGSSNETESHLIHATRIGLLDKRRSDELLSEIEEIRRMLYGLRRYLQSPRQHERPTGARDPSSHHGVAPRPRSAPSAALRSDDVWLSSQNELSPED